MTTDTIQETAPRRAVPAYLTLAAGAMFVVVPLLVQLVSGDAFALMGLAGLLFLAALPGPAAGAGWRRRPQRAVGAAADDGRARLARWC